MTHLRRARLLAAALTGCSPPLRCRPSCPTHFLCVEAGPDEAVCADTQTACGGVDAKGCPDNRRCVDDPRDSCDPRHGGADCPGLCME